jgi:hypothetical protein
MGDAFRPLQTGVAATEATACLPKPVAVQSAFSQLQPAAQMVLDACLEHIAAPTEAVA